MRPMPSRADEIDAARIHRRLVDLIRVPSITGDEDAAIARIADWLQSTSAEVDHWYEGMAKLLADPAYPGHEVERAWAPVVAGVVRGTRPGPTVMLTGHVDVVPPGDYSQWTVEPYAGITREDRVYGRGSCDMKSGLIAALEAFHAFAEGARNFAGRVIFVAVPAEEDSGLGTLAAIRRGWVPDVAIIPEPTALDGHPQLVVAHAGAMSLLVEILGVAAHARKRLAGETALDHYLHVHDALRLDERTINDAERDPLMRALELPYATNVGRIRGGTWSSSVMDRLEVELRVGVPLGESTAETQERIRRAITEGTAHVPWLARNPPKLTRLAAGFGSARTPENQPLVQLALEASGEAFGRPARLTGAPYGCDMAAWVRIANRPTIVYGPGELDNAHATDEWVSLDQTVRVSRMLARTTEKLLALGRGSLASFSARHEEVPV